jgi:hypothetical protein
MKARSDGVQYPCLISLSHITDTVFWEMNFSHGFGFPLKTKWKPSANVIRNWSIWPWAIAWYLKTAWPTAKETLTIKGDAAGLEEAVVALTKGALITELQLIYKSGSVQWVFAIKGESLSMSGIKLPETGPVTSETDLEGAILEKIYLYEKPIELMDKIYAEFLKKRLSEDWGGKIIPALQQWLRTEQSLGTRGSKTGS